jgi:hypothetical protein
MKLRRQTIHVPWATEAICWKWEIEKLNAKLLIEIRSSKQGNV